LAAIQERNGSYRVLFRHHGKQHTFTLGRVSEAEAKAKAVGKTMKGSLVIFRGTFWGDKDPANPTESGRASRPAQAHRRAWILGSAPRSQGERVVEPESPSRRPDRGGSHPATFVGFRPIPGVGVGHHAGSTRQPVPRGAI
jgi:hypothetical protein